MGYCAYFIGTYARIYMWARESKCPGSLVSCSVEERLEVWVKGQVWGRGMLMRTASDTTTRKPLESNRRRKRSTAK